MRAVRPPRLRAGETVAVLSPSWGGPSLFPHVFDRGVSELERRFQIKVREFPSTRADPETLWRNPELRAADVNAAFADPEVRAIVSSIGGDDSCRILPHLDADTIRANPKVLLGFSDTTTLLTFVRSLGMVTFHGPSIMAGFSQASAVPPEFERHLREILFDAERSHEYVPFGQYSDGYPRWEDPETVGQVSRPHEDSGWHWVQGAGRARGELWGGCLEVLEFLKGTEYWPRPSFFRGKVLFLEGSEAAPTPVQVKWMLRNYGMQGVFEGIRGLLIGRARGYGEDEKRQLDDAVRSVVAEEFGKPDLPIVTNMDFGHTDPQFPLPLGVRCLIDFGDRRFRLTEAAVS
ncbi:MAG: LD-carboxypeptidase [Thermoplasmata archaeon]|nr:LD-carboxypeptidase [Thermoplasmata archaeon]